jgi:hypothetical protein
MMAGESPPELFMSNPKKPNNLKTALILASVALMFAFGLFVKRMWFA